MQELLKEHLGEIALLIYIFYPLLKRWWNRVRKPKGGEEQQPKKAKSKRKRARPATVSRKAARRERKRPEKGSSAPPVAKRPAGADFLDAGLSQLKRTKKEANALLARAQADPRLARFVPAVKEDLLARLALIERSLRSNPPLSTIVQDTTALRGLDALVGNLTTMARQRTLGRSSFLTEADAMADSYYAPLIEFARAQGLDLNSSTPVAMSGDWDLSIVPRFASTRLAPLRLPVGFEHSLWRWPAIAHEVAHDFYYSLDGFAPSLHARLGLPRQVELPVSSAEVDGAWIRGLFGAWLAETFADVMGTVMVGPAYVETMRRAFRNPGSPQQTAAILQDRNLMDEHPPARLRLFMGTRVLHQLGRHEEADELWERWEGEHHDVQLYYLPLGGRWVGISDDALHSIASSIIDELILRAWPELEGFHLLNIPGLAYLHAEHAEVERTSVELARGVAVDAEVRWVVAAAVLAAAAQPALHDQILETARRSIEGMGEPDVTPTPGKRARQPSGTIAQTLVASLKEADAIEEAIVLGAALTPYRAPRWH
ncbi:MAG: hypothetical protein ACN4G0_10840 [Polyangiales bacterium]